MKIKRNPPINHQIKSEKEELNKCILYFSYILINTIKIKY